MSENIFSDVKCVSCLYSENPEVERLEIMVSNDSTFGRNLYKKA